MRVLSASLLVFGVVLFQVGAAYAEDVESVSKKEAAEAMKALGKAMSDSKVMLASIRSGGASEESVKFAQECFTVSLSRTTSADNAGEVHLVKEARPLVAYFNERMPSPGAAGAYSIDEVTGALLAIGLELRREGGSASVDAFYERCAAHVAQEAK